MRKKLLIASIVSLLLSSVLFIVNGYRFSRDSFYKDYAKLGGSHSYNEIYKTKDYAIVAYDDYIMEFNFDNLLFIKRLRPRNMMGDYYFNYEMGGSLYSNPEINIFPKDSLLDINYQIFKHALLVYTDVDNVEFSFGHIQDNSQDDPNLLRKTKIDDGLYLYQYYYQDQLQSFDYTETGLNLFAYQSTNDTLKRIIIDKKITANYSNISFENKHYDTKEFIDPLKNLDSVNTWSLDRNDNYEIILQYNEQDPSHIHWKPSYQTQTTTYFRYDNRIYYTHNLIDSDEIIEANQVDTELFEIAYEQFKRVFQ